MKIYVLSHNKPDRVRTAALFKDSRADWRIVVSYEAQAIEYRKHLPAERILVSNTSAAGSVYKRRWIQDQTKPGEWYMLLADDISSIGVFGDEYYAMQNIPADRLKDAKISYRHSIAWRELEELLQEDIVRADKIGAHLLGFATNSNLLFRVKKYREVGFVMNTALCIKNDGIMYPIELPVKSDYGLTAEHLKRNGVVLVNNHIYFKWHPDKAIRLARQEKDIAAASYIMQKYPGLYRYRKRPGRPDGSEIVMRIHSRAGIDKWRLGI